MAAQTLRASNGVEFKVYNVTKGGKQVVLLVDHSTGRRRVLNCADMAAAQKRANAIAAAMLKGQAARQAVSEAEWQTAVVALDIARRNHTPLLEALKEWAICDAKLDGKATISEAVAYFLANHTGGPAPTKMTVNEAWAIMQARQEKQSASHQQTTASKLKSFLEKHGSRDVTSFTSGEIEAWLDNRASHPVAWNKHRTALQSLFGHAHKAEAIKVNPVKVLQRRREERGDVAVYSPADMANLIAAAQQVDADCLIYAALGAFAGIRPEEVTGNADHGGVRWEDIGTASIKVPKSIAKNRHDRTIALQPNLAALLAPYRQVSGPVVTPGFSGKEASSKIPRRAGVRWLHDGLRHSFSTYRAVQAGHLTACKENGDSLAIFDRHYLSREAISKETAEAYFALGMPAGNVVAMTVNG